VFCSDELDAWLESETKSLDENAYIDNGRKNLDSIKYSVPSRQSGYMKTLQDALQQRANNPVKVTPLPCTNTNFDKGLPRMIKCLGNAELTYSWDRACKTRPSAVPAAESSEPTCKQKPKPKTESPKSTSEEKIKPKGITDQKQPPCLSAKEAEVLSDVVEIKGKFR